MVSRLFPCSDQLKIKLFFSLSLEGLVFSWTNYSKNLATNSSACMEVAVLVLEWEEESTVNWWPQCR